MKKSILSMTLVLTFFGSISMAESDSGGWQPELGISAQEAEVIEIIRLTALDRCSGAAIEENLVAAFGNSEDLLTLDLNKLDAYTRECLNK